MTGKKKGSKGSLSINSENIFPIIKKWLYSDQDIFIRELISNGVDAVTKLKRLSSLGEAELPEGETFRVTVYASAKEKTLVFEDNGIGMTMEEVDKYINQIAFSGASDFLEKYKDKDSQDQIIGHFGLGFYSAFMVADKVEIDTLSYTQDAEPVHWECDGGTEYSMEMGMKSERGTRITLHLSEDCLKFCNAYMVREVINKYCSFMPVEIFFVDEDEAKKKADELEVKKKENAEKKAKKKAEAEEDDLVGDSPAKEETEEEDDIVETEEDEEVEKALNDTHPLWMKTPGDCTDEEYKDFFQKVFYDFKEPLFWIHLNMDYPFNLKGILYFPRINPEVDQLEGKVKLYNNQVFVADNIKEVIPEFLLVLKGVIDCPDLPLNVSRSALQNDGFVQKISDHITKKVADKLIGMCKNHREDYEKLWDDLSPFVKFGCLRDEKFNEKIRDSIIFKNLEGKYVSLAEYLEAAKETHENQVFYVTDEQLQAQYIEMFKSQGIDAVYMTHNIDNPFITSLEAKNDKVKFLRIDAEVNQNLQGEKLSEEEEKKYTEKLQEVFRRALNNEHLSVKVDRLKDDSVSAMLTQSEDARRMADMMKAYGMAGMNLGNMGQNSETLVLNAGNDLVNYVMENPEGELTDMVCCQLYDLAALANRPLTAEELTRFVKRSNEILQKMTK